jgi:hypothetical protein
METRFIRLVASLLGLALLALGLLLGQAALVQAQPGVLYVAPGGSCSGTPNCFANVQAGGRCCFWRRNPRRRNVH